MVRLRCSLSTVSKPKFARKYALESSRRDLHNALLCTVLNAQNFVQKSLKILPIFRQSLLIVMLTIFRLISARICRNFSGFPNEARGEMYRVPGGYPQATPQGPRSLHFRGKRPIPRLPELAHAAPLGLRPLSATSPLWSRSASSKSRFAAAASSPRRDLGDL